MVVVDAWPASDRPYIGGSTNNTVLNLALGYNGFSRVDGQSQGGGGARSLPNPSQGQRLPNGTAGGRAQTPGGPPGQPGGPAPSGSVQVPRAQPAPTRPSSAGGFSGIGGIIGGLPSLLRMFDDANGGQIGWLLPFALGGALVALWSWRRDPVRRAFAVLFLGWVLLYGGIFSYAQGIYHSYYTSAMAPGVAALVGVGTVALASAVRRDRRWLIVAVGLVGLTLWTQLQIAGRTPEFYGWVRPLAVAAALAGVVVVAALSLRRLPVASALALSVTGLLLLPAAWSWNVSASSPLNATLPQAGPRQGASGGTFGSQAFDSGTPQLAAWLKSHNDAGATWQLVVPNSQDASLLIAEYGESVMSLGGFMGSDNTISVAGFADLVSSGAVRYVLAQGGPVAFGRVLPNAGTDGRTNGGTQARIPGGLAVVATSGPNAVMSAVQSACTLVSDAPSNYRSSLYDCAGQADAMRQLLP
jgi:4-amino-4-deoxy-L-arabinose transferase-like glycosyltransferase